MKYYIDQQGAYLGGYDGVPPLGSIEVPTCPESALQVWNGATWVDTFPQIVAQFDAAVEEHLRLEAVSCGYTNIERACMYSSYPNPYWDESRSFVAWVGAVWAYCFEQVELVRIGLRPVPTIPQIISELPTRTIP